ncbi:MAG: caspase family protein, partial [Gemmatimonadota bacterium]
PGAGDDALRTVLVGAVDRVLKTRYESIEHPRRAEVSVLVKGRSEILSPAGDLSVGRTPRADTRYRLSANPVPLGARWVYIDIARPGELQEKVEVRDQGGRLLQAYAGTEFRVQARDVVRFFVDEQLGSAPDSARAAEACDRFALAYPGSPLATTAGLRARQLRGEVPVSAALPTSELVTDVDVDIPHTGIDNPDAVAVVIGNAAYSVHTPEVPDVAYALRDAAVVRRYLVDVLGFREGNILYHENATGAVFRRLFGTQEVPEGRLAQLVRPERSDVFVYYSGHGAPDVGGGKAYFVPVDCEPGDLLLNGYSLDLFYANLALIPARSVTVVIDACFSGGSDRGMLISAASPLGIRVTDPTVKLERAAVFTSSTGDEISSWYPQAGHGLFTYFFLKGLRGDADADGDGAITAAELHAFVADGSDGVPYWARRLHGGRRQTPELHGDPGRTILAPPAAIEP